MTYREEPLGLGSKQGFGHYDAQFGEVIRSLDPCLGYRIERKLGWGIHSSVWLARELREDGFVALKILTTYASSLHRDSLMIEVDAPVLLMGHPNIIRALHDFTIPAKSGSNHPENEEHTSLSP
ncbi:hypothetical protein GSI_01910 [Ganoderma sinense ZZ0214-1]|uniref:Protein kinase domain-containing protein n=1 Tax=Ganoderma sinense ZZ0214-1 TaxID=1077348 RepID=A0A2G8SRP7_9APHY|nr:hypothetical protein GSI_01910 [Ganoderma sinense ZZ0214-1]